jgi:protein O-mannosyl-transferase
MTGSEHSPAGEGTPWWQRFSTQAIVLALLCMACYANTFTHEYALDDTLVIVRNEYVHQGLAGIPDILTKDAYYSYYKQLKSTDQVSGGRYRPLSIVTFAIEQQFFGATSKDRTDSLIAYGLTYEHSAPFERRFISEMHTRHVVNVLLYALGVVVLLYFLRQVVFPRQAALSFTAAALFAVHPLHTEVVANVKSRDELLSLLFICLTFIFAFRYREAGKKGQLAAALGCYLLAFLSKEYAITLVALLPLSFYLFCNDSISRSFKRSIPYFVLAALYLIVRFQVIGPRNELSDNDIQINPYAYASPTEKLATEIATSLNYLRLLVYPHPLSSDYSYPQIPYKDFTMPIVWLSLLVHLALVAGIVYFFRKRSVLCFALSFYLLDLLMVNNFIFDIGATMGERLIYHASVGFFIAVTWLVGEGIRRLSSVQVRHVVATGLLGCVVALCSSATIQRNKAWKNDETLFMTDINTVPNSFLVNANVACMLINRSDLEQDSVKRADDLKKGIDLYGKVIAMQQNYVLGYMNRCTGYYKQGNTDSMVVDLNRILALYPIHPQLPEMYYYAGMQYMDKKQYGQADRELRQSLKLFPNSRQAQMALQHADSLLNNNR